jgi:hypothetical protein
MQNCIHRPYVHSDNIMVAQAGPDRWERVMKKRVAASLDEDLGGWFDFGKSRRGVSMSSYLCTLAQEDRDRTAEQDPETWSAYLKYLDAVGKTDELKQMKAEHPRKASK